jgi:hypothetical protein
LQMPGYKRYLQQQETMHGRTHNRRSSSATKTTGVGGNRHESTLNTKEIAWHESSCRPGNSHG